MVVDTSALLAIATGEQDYERCLSAIVNAKTAVMSTVSLYEACVALFMKRRSRDDVSDLMSLVSFLGIEILDFDVAQAAEAREAYLKYGKGVHPAGLNFGDCPAYALAKTRNEALLFKGDDFTKTDIVPAL